MTDVDYLRRASEAVHIDTDAARERENRGEIALASSHYHSALQGLLSIAVNGFADVESGVGYMHSEGVADKLAKLAVLGPQAASMGQGGLKYDVCVALHVGWLVGERGFCERYAPMLKDRAVSSTKFWSLYGDALTALIDEASWQAKPPKLRGLEKFWITYVELISALSSGEDLAPPLRAIAEGFAARNKDKRLGGDDKRIEGTGHGPVNWDFRMASLARFAKERYDQDLVSMASWPFEWTL